MTIFGKLTLTPAQRRALDWLPEDGSWRTDPGRLVAALNSLSLAGGCEGEWGDFGSRGGRKMRWRRLICIDTAGDSQ